MALRRDIYLSPDRVRARAVDYPLVAALLGDRLEGVLRDDRKRVDAAPLLLRLLEQEGEGSAAMLERLEGGLSRFDDLEPEGWASWKGALPGADRTTCLSRYSELLVALTFADWGYEIQAFEPAGAAGKLADLSIGIAGETVLVETTSPGPHEHDWIDSRAPDAGAVAGRVRSDSRGQRLRGPAFRGSQRMGC